MKTKDFAENWTEDGPQVKRRARQCRDRRLELLRHEQVDRPLPLDRINQVGLDTLTGADIAAIWQAALAFPIYYAGGDTSAFEQNLRQVMPLWMAYDMRMMGERFLTDGMLPEGGDVEHLKTLLGCPIQQSR